MDFTRQLNIFDPEENQQFSISLIGCGSVGSFTALALVKMGVNLIEIFDSDVLEKHNLPNQFFRKDQVGMSKTGALLDLLSEFVEVVPKAFKNVDDKTKLKGVIVISTVDSIEARKLIWRRVKASKPMFYIDSRMGGKIFSVHSVDMLNKEAVDAYEKNLFGIHKGLDLPCTERSIIFNILGLASIICNQIVAFASEKGFSKTVHFDYENYIFLKD